MVSIFVSLFGFLWRWTFYSFIRSVIFYQWKLKKSIELRKKCNRDVYIWKYISVCKNILIYYSYYTLISTYRGTNIFWQFDRSTILFFDPFSWYKNISCPTINFTYLWFDAQKKNRHACKILARVLAIKRTWERIDAF